MKSGSEQFLGINLKIWLWEKPEASNVHYTSPLTGLKHGLGDDWPHFSWEKQDHTGPMRNPEFRIKTISWNQCENMIVRKSWNKQHALHIPSTRLQTWTWRWCPKMLVRKAGSRRTDTQSRKSATNIYILKCNSFENMFERKTCSMRDAKHKPYLRIKTIWFDKMIVNKSENMDDV